MRRPVEAVASSGLVRPLGGLDCTSRVRLGSHTNPKRQRGSRLLALALRASVPGVSPAIEPRPSSFYLFDLVLGKGITDRRNWPQRTPAHTNPTRLRLALANPCAHKPDAPARGACDWPQRTPAHTNPTRQRGAPAMSPGKHPAEPAANSPHHFCSPLTRVRTHSSPLRPKNSVIASIPYSDCTYG
jgi:hypothetical protein